MIPRFEDLIFRPKQVINEVCTCAGAVPATADQGFQYVVDAGKWGSAHQHSSNNMITAMQKYGSAPHRFDGWNRADRTFVRQHEDTQKLLQLFQYAVDENDDDGSEPHSRRQ